MRFPQMVFRPGDMLPEHGVDYLVVECEAELVNALADGWREELVADEAPAVALEKHPLDHDGDGKLGGSLPKRKPGRPRKAD